MSTELKEPEQRDLSILQVVSILGGLLAMGIVAGAAGYLLYRMAALFASVSP